MDHDAKQAYPEARAILPFSPRGAAVLARRALQRVIHAKLQIKKRTLFEEIGEARTRPDLSKSTAEAIEHIRGFGNWAAHPSSCETAPDPAETLRGGTLEQARYTIQVLELVFHDLYEFPAKIQAMNVEIGKS